MYYISGSDIVEHIFLLISIELKTLGIINIIYTPKLINLEVD